MPTNQHMAPLVEEEEEEAEAAKKDVLIPEALNRENNEQNHGREFGEHPPRLTTADAAKEPESINVSSPRGVKTNEEEQYKQELHDRNDISGLSPAMVASLDTSGTDSRDALVDESDDSSGPDSPSVAEPLLGSMKVCTFGRLKSRLLDPPPLFPAMKGQLAYSSSRLLKRNSLAPDTVLAQNAAITPDHGNPSCCQVPSQEPPQNIGVAQANPNLEHTLSTKINVATLPNKDEELDPLDENFMGDLKEDNESRWLVVLQLCSLFGLVALLVCTVRIPRLEKVTFLGLNLWRWQALTLVIFCGHLISGWIMKFFVSCVEKHYLLKKRVLYFVYGLRHSVKNCIWLALVLGVWEVIFQGHEDTTAVNIMTKILWCLFTTSVSWMLKVLAVKVAASSFHRTAYFDRIQHCVFSQYLLERLSGPAIIANDFGTDDEKGGSRGKQTTRKQKNQSQSFPTEKGLRRVQSATQGSGTEAKTLDNLSDFKTSQSRDIKKSSSERLPQKDVQKQECETSTIYANNRPSKEEATAERPAAENLHHNVIEVGCPTSIASASDQLPDKKVRMADIPIPMQSPDAIQHEKLQELTSDTVPLWTLKRLMKTVRNTNLKAHHSLLPHEKGAATINSEVQAKIVAKKVFYNMARPGQKCITLQNFLYFLPEEQATNAFSLFVHNEAGEITRGSFMKWVVDMYKERRALCLTLNDNKTVVEKLHHALNMVLAMILIAVFALIFGLETSKVLLFISSIIVPSVFMFGNSAKNTFESIIFLFVTHPFDVGDCVVVDGQILTVEEINLINTIFLSPSNEKIYYPNSVLTSKPISNYHRSPHQWDAVEFQIHMKTPTEKLLVLKERLQKYLEGLPHMWYPDFHMVCKDIDDSTKMKMAVWLRHRLNFQEGGERHERRSKFLLYMKQQLEDLSITYYLPQQPVQIVSGTPTLDTIA